MVEPSIRFDIAAQGRDKSLAFGGYPIKDSTFQALRVITSGPRGSFAQLLFQAVRVSEPVLGDWTHELRNMGKVFFRPI